MSHFRICELLGNCIDTVVFETERHIARRDPVTYKDAMSSLFTAGAAEEWL